MAEYARDGIDSALSQRSFDPSVQKTAGDTADCIAPKIRFTLPVLGTVESRAFIKKTTAHEERHREDRTMWGGIIGLVIQLIAGAVGGNVAGATLKQYDLGMIGNTIAGIVGGGVGAQVIGALIGGGAQATGTGDLDIGSIVGQIASGGVGGGILMVIVGLIKQAMGGQRPA